MILIEFEEDLNYESNILKYRDVEDDNWYYLYIDIETLNLLITNFGIISIKRMPTEHIYIDTPLTSKIINAKYCNAQIEMHCGNNASFNISLLGHNY